MPSDPLLDRFKLPEAGGGGGAQAAAAAAAAALSPFLGLPPPFNLPPFMPPPPPPPPPPTSSSLAAVSQSTKDATAASLNPFAAMDHLSLLNLARSASALQQKQQQQQSLSPPKSKSPNSPKKTGTYTRALLGIGKSVIQTHCHINRWLSVKKILLGGKLSS